MLTNNIPLLSVSKVSFRELLEVSLLRVVLRSRALHVGPQCQRCGIIPHALPFYISGPQVSVNADIPKSVCDLGSSRWGAGSPPFGSHSTDHYKDLGNSTRKGCTPALRPGCWPSMSLGQTFSSLEVVMEMLYTLLSHSWAQGGTILVPLRTKNPFCTWEPSSFPASGWWRRDIHFSEQYSLPTSARHNLDPVAWISPLKLL